MKARSTETAVPPAGRPDGGGGPGRSGRDLLQGIDEIAAAGPDSLALRSAICAICQHSGWDYAEIWLPDPASGLWRAHPYWFGDRQRFQGFRKLSQDIALVVPLPLVQRVARQRSTPWYADVSVVPLAEYRRAKAANAAGLKATLAVPVTAAQETLAVLVFMTAGVREPNKRLSETIATAAARLAPLFTAPAPDLSAASSPIPPTTVCETVARHFGARLERLSPREHDVLQLTLDGLTASELAARLGLSHRTVEVHRASLLRKLGLPTTTRLLAEVLAAAVGSRDRR